MEEPQERPGKPAFIVGIGASAGGLNALEQFFENMPAHSGMAFVVIQHLSPDFKSLMDDLLSRRTQMPIHRVLNGMEIEADSIYLIPSRSQMTVQNGRLFLTERIEKTSTGRVELPIDVFFRSLALDARERSFGIILSGTGSDGSRGIQAIHEQGGVVMVQTPESAQFDGMPRAAIATGTADFILSPDRMPRLLTDCAENPLAVKASLAQRLDVVEEEGEFAEIFALMRRSYRLDFSKYKAGTVGRRITRRMEFRQIDNISDYAAILSGDPQELDALYKDLLIGVTEFFRDLQAFHFLETIVVPELFANRRGEPDIRVWTAACATGEEAYSLTILLVERAQEIGFTGKITVFATDVHKSSLETASQGIFRREALANVSEARLARFFRQETPDSFRVNADLRKLVVFAPHNLLSDPPFTRIDLVCCRNLLIYFQPPVQEKVICLFHFSLKKGSVLFLGSSEGLGSFSNEFEVLSAPYRIFRKIRDLKLAIDLDTRFSDKGSPAPPVTVRTAATKTVSVDRQLLQDYDAILRRHVPPGILVDENRRVVHYFGDVASYLRIEGRLSGDVLQMAEGNLQIAISTTLQLAERTRQSVSTPNVRADRGGDQVLISVKVDPIPGERGGVPHHHIYFEELRPVETPSVPLPEGLSIPDGNLESFAQYRQHLLDTEAELQSTRESLQATIEELQATIEELQTTNEELQATNEELLAANEELQSTNEELHSVNEELYSVNAEFESKNAELKQLNRDHDNLLNSTEVGTVFLDRDMRIRRFNPAINAFFKLLPQDVGRPIDHIAYHLPGRDHLLASIATVLETGEVREREIQAAEDVWLLKRVFPFRTEVGQVEGVVLTFIDVSRLKKAERSLQLVVEELEIKVQEGAKDLVRAVELRREADAAARESLTQYRALVNGLPDTVMRFDRQGRHRFVSPNIGQMLGLNPGEVMGKTHRDLGLPDAFCRVWEDAIARVFETATPIETEVSLETGKGLAIYNCRLVPELNGGPAPKNVLGISRDVTAYRRAEQDYRTLFNEMLDGFAHYELITDPDGQPVDYRFLSINPAFEDMTGMRAVETIGRSVAELMPGREPRGLEFYGRVVTTGEPAKFDEFSHSLGKHLEVKAYPTGPRQFACFFADITARKRAEEEKDRLQMQLAQSQKMESIGRLAGGIAHDFNNLLTIINGYSRILLSKMTASDPLFVPTGQILQAGERAAALTRQLLAFSRKQLLQPQRLNLNQTLDTMRTLLLRVVEEDIELHVDLMAERADIFADHHQLEQVLMNLVVNARDAMPMGGSLAIRTENPAENPRGSPDGLPLGNPGGYVALSVADTGCGMDEETRRQIFEPFFTTKGPGKGTGLGLSMVQGVVAQSGGQIEVETEPGRGTTFRIFLPLHPTVEGAGAQDQAKADGTTSEPARGGPPRTLLVVEDQPDVRDLVVGILAAEGYRVLAAGDAETALRICETEHPEIDLLITDVVMPKVNGGELAARVARMLPGIRMVFMSGHTARIIEHEGILDSATHFLQKPFAPEDLVRKVRTVLA